jgi:hypothetical protein
MTTPVGNVTGSVQLVASINNQVFQSAVNAQGTVGLSPSITAPAIVSGAAGSLVEATGTTGTITFSGPHGLAGTETLAVFWTGGYAWKVTITSQTTNSITVSAAAGTAFPAGTTAVNVAVGQPITDLSMIGSNLQELIISSTQTALVDLLDSVPTSRLTELVGPSNGNPGPYIWPQTAGESTPFSQTIVDVMVYNNSTQSAVFTLLAVMA